MSANPVETSGKLTSKDKKYEVNEMSEWEDLQIELKIKTILEDIEDDSENHHFGTPYLTVYQIAMEYAEQYPEDLERMEYDVGGKDIGVHYSFSQYIAKELSTRIKNKKIRDIEGRFISNKFVSNLVFDSDNYHLESSVIGDNYTISMFRLK